MGNFQIQLEYSFFVLFASFRRVDRKCAFSSLLVGHCGPFPSNPLNVPGFEIINFTFLDFNSLSFLLRIFLSFQGFTLSDLLEDRSSVSFLIRLFLFFLSSFCRVYYLARSVLCSATTLTRAIPGGTEPAPHEFSLLSSTLPDPVR